MRWNPEQYALFPDHRSRPFFDLVGRIGPPGPRRVVDLGCGPGELTAVLARRWPDARVSGIDSSAEMIHEAESMTDRPSNLEFTVGDLATWMPESGTDVVVSNAVLQWIPGHAELLARWAEALEPGAWLAVQVPGNFNAPSHALMRTLADSDVWRHRLGGVLRHNDAVAEPADYLRLFATAGFTADVWETTYQQVLPGPDPVLQWVRGTGLRPVLDVLSADDAAAFESEYSLLLREAYPPESFGTIFPFRRIFMVGVKGGAA